MINGFRFSLLFSLVLSFYVVQYHGPVT